MSFAQVLGEKERFERVSIKLSCKEKREILRPDKEYKFYCLVLTIVFVEANLKLTTTHARIPAVHYIQL